MIVIELEHNLGLLHGTIVRIIEQLGFHKVCARWVPRAPSEDLKSQRVVSALTFPQTYAIHGHDFL